ncbi:MAG: hypothetical protein AAB896_01190 [Patescibacteria group bacterium]
MRLVLLCMLAGAGLVFFIIVIGGLSFLSAKTQELIELEQRSRTVDAQSSNLAASKKQVEQYAYFNDIAKTVLPSDKDQAQAVLDIFSLADQSGIAIASVTFPASSLGTKATAPASNNAATAPTASVISQAKLVEGIAGLYSLELTISPQTGPGVPDAKQVTYSKLLDFLGRIEHNRRTAQITQVNIQPQGSDSGPTQFINFTMTINIFMKP